MKRFVAIFQLLLFANLTHAQTSEKAFENYRLADVGYISIPSSMEVQSGKYKKLTETFEKEVIKQFGFEVSGNRIVFQQKGLNDLESSAFASYARVIIETDIGNPGDFEKITTAFSATEGELRELNQELKSQINQNFQGTKLRLIRWQGATIVTLNGRTALKISYLRQLADQPFVQVNMYRFQNYDRMHSLTLSYRQNEEDKWKSDFQKILRSFTITNIR